MPKLTILGLLIALLFQCSIAQTAETEVPRSLVIAPRASDVKRSTDGYLHDGCTSLAYTAQEPYPGKATLSFISRDLQSQRWVRENRVQQQWAPGSPGHPKSIGKWTHFRSLGGSATYVREEQWSRRDRGITSYVFWYFAPDLRTVHVDARYCPSRVIEKYRCIPDPLPSHDEQAYSLELKITKIEPAGRDFRVFVTLRNSGLKPVLLGVNGTLPGGEPELWVLGLQQEEQGEWSSVDAVCAEHPAFDWINLKPGGSIDSWALAVDFPEPNHHFAKCLRRIGHLHRQDKIRAIVRYYTNACEIEERVENKAPYFSTSEPVAFPEPGR